MSQQGPGGYGGYPPGGGPPGGGAPPGGHGPPGGYGPPGAPPGGYGPPGAPPGGYGPPGAPPGGYGPPGAPPGWGQQPPHGAPQPYGAPPPPPGPPQKKGTSPVVWLGVGCGVLFLFGGASTAWFFYSASRGISAALEAGAALADAGVTVTPPAAPGGAVVVPAPGLATGGPVCEQAAKCCRSMVAKSGGNPAAEAACDNMKVMPLIGCTQALETYKRSAPLVGATCP